jgi:hypothetical protein
MKKLPLVYECERRFDEMHGDATVRHCDDCDRKVVNLSSLDEKSARSLLAQRSAPVCVHYRHLDGKIQFAKRTRAVAFAAAAAILLASAPARTDTSPPEPPRKHESKKERKHKEPKKKPIEDADGILMPNF